MSADFEVMRAARNEILRTLDVSAARGWGMFASSDEVVMCALHKARYDCVDIERELRHASGAWLRERGYSAMGGRALEPEGELP